MRKTAAAHHHLPWFTNRQESGIFDTLGYACVFASGPKKGRPLRIARSTAPLKWLAAIQADHWQPILVHEIAWTAGLPIARRLEAEIERILDKAGRRLNGSWFDVTPDLILPTFHVAAGNLDIETFTHDEMLARVAGFRERAIERVLRS